MSDTAPKPEGAAPPLNARVAYYRTLVSDSKRLCSVILADVASDLEGEHMLKLDKVADHRRAIVKRLRSRSAELIA
jgi:hypothetical protein